MQLIWHDCWCDIIIVQPLPLSQVSGVCTKIRQKDLNGVLCTIIVIIILALIAQSLPKLLLCHWGINPYIFFLVELVIEMICCFHFEDNWIIAFYKNSNVYCFQPALCHISLALCNSRIICSGALHVTCLFLRHTLDKNRMSVNRVPYFWLSHTKKSAFIRITNILRGIQCPLWQWGWKYMCI